MTVSALGAGGYSLLFMKVDSRTSSINDPKPSATETGSNAQLAVNVFNATKTSGLARQRADFLTNRNWTIKTIGNWSGPKVSRSTIFYPEGGRASAMALSAVVVAQVLRAPTQLAADSLTYVIKS